VCDENARVPVDLGQDSDAEVGPVGDAHRLGQSRPEALLDVVEDAGHASVAKVPTGRRPVKGRISGPRMRTCL